MLFAENEIITFQNPEGKTVTERILWLDEGGYILYSIDLFDKNALPVKHSISSLKELLNEQILSFVNDDPYLVFYREEDIKEDRKIKREARWEVIKTLVTHEPDIYESIKRGPLINETVLKSGKNKRLIYDYLRKYWQRGKTKNSLLPDYQNSGAGGKGRTLGDKKTGRPRKNALIIGQGINVTDEIKKIFHVSIAKFYHTSKQNPLTTSYKLMLKNFFVDEYRFDGGVKKPILKNQNEIPTIEQFRYWYENNYNLEAKLKKRKGDRKFQLEDRPILGSSTKEMYGPGSKYQIDATVADVYIVSQYNRNWIVGRPVIYVVIDVFSRMVVGLYVGLEGPSWMGAMMALMNTVSDKLNYCSQYGIAINEEEWRCRHLPQILLADRGELEGYNPERLITSFGLKMENTPPYRADWKGIVEQHFRIINLKVKPFLPGAIDKDFLVRGGKDYRLDGKLNLFEFTQIIIRCVLHHNNKHSLRHYSPGEMMIEDEVSLIPRELWDWGIKNRSGKLKVFPEERVMLHLLPAGKATVTGKGIVFNKMSFSCDRALKEGWFTEARKKSWKVDISYDPRNMSYIYIRNEDGRTFEKCNLLDHQKRYKDKTFDDVQYLLAFEQLQQDKNKGQQIQGDVDLMSDIEHIVSLAESDYKKQELPLNKSERLRGIRGNRLAEKEANRQQEFFELGKREQKENATVFEIPTPSREEEQEEYNFPKSVDLLRQKQKEKLLHAKKR